LDRTGGARNAAPGPRRPAAQRRQSAEVTAGTEGIYIEGDGNSTVTAGSSSDRVHFNGNGDNHLMSISRNISLRMLQIYHQMSMSPH
jgi:hypothetical protein